MTQAGPPQPRSADNAVATPGDSVAAPAQAEDVTPVTCPCCHKGVRVDRARIRPGRFRLKCGACRETFGMIVADDGAIRTGRIVERAPEEQDDLPPEIAATLGMNRPAVTAPPRRPRPRPEARTLAPGESMAGMSGSYAALPSETLSGVSADGSLAGATVAPDTPGGSSGPRGFVSPPSQAGPSLPPPEIDAGDRLDGYELRRKLGEGGMGAVYLARQMSLDRDVALKVLSPKLSAHPALVSRFMREAYAAGQLVHHNVVQIYDFGKDKPRKAQRTGDTGDGPAPDREIHFFSMEFVDGESLQNLVKQRGRLEPKEAVSLVLQAARGLAFAHEHGIIHRDIKPDNLMLNRLGILKVADLGLVKQIGTSELAPATPTLPEGAGDTTVIEPTPGSLSAVAAAEITQASAMMGTPAYMPPEQAADAKSADARADIYALGCTLYHLVVGHPPFGGATLQEVLEAHRTQRVRFPDPAEGGPKISSRLKEIIRRLCGKSPQERFGSMPRLIRELEEYLAEKHQVIAEPDEQQQKTLEWAAHQFNASSWSRLRPLLIISFVTAVLAGIVVSWAIFPPLIAFGVVGGLIGMTVLAFLFSFILGGRRRRDVLYTKSRELVLGAGPVDWIVGIVAFGLLVTVLVNFGWGWWWLGAAAVALALAWGWQGMVDRGVQRDQEPMVARSQRVLREMREAGMEEARIRRAVAEAGGKHWEAFYEAMFGYEAKLDARKIYGVDEQGRERPRFAPWRDPILAWLNDSLERRRLKRDQRLLKALHKNELLAQGIKSDVADRAAKNQARREIGKAALLREQIMEELRREMRQEMLRSGSPEREPDQRDASQPEQQEEESPESGKRRRSRKIRYTTDDFERIHESYFRRRFGTPLDLLLGQQVRFAIAAALLLCFTLWFSQNQEAIFIGDALAADVPAADVPLEEELERQVALRGDESARQLAAPWWQRIWSAGEPLELWGLPPGVTRFLSGFHVGLAGLLMMLGAFFYGRLLGIATLVSMVLIILLPHALPDPAWWIAVASGVAVWGAGVFFLRVSED